MFAIIKSKIKDLWDNLCRESRIPAPPFKASKRMGKIMYGLWYGRITIDEARDKAEKWGFSEADTEDMIKDATKPPSYWSQNG